MAPMGSNGMGRQQQRLKQNRRGKGSSNTTHTNVEDDIPSSSYQRAKSSISIELQQLILDIFQTTFSEKFDSALQLKIQDVKQHLFSRDFAQAFGTQEYLDAYAMRWSPSRALAYLDILISPRRIFMPSQSPKTKYHHALSDDTDIPTDIPVGDPPAHKGECSLFEEEQNGTRMKIVSLGGGAGAELVALAGLLCQSASSSKEKQTTDAGLLPLVPYFDATFIDVADWSSIISRLHASVTTSPAQSKYASNRQAVQASMASDESFQVTFMQQDLLTMEVSRMGQLLEDCALVTLMFTLNELYSISMSATTSFLLSMTSLMRPGSLLLVADSPGSYSTVNVGEDVKGQAPGAQKEPKACKKYPMLWLLDHTLLVAATVGSSSTGGEQWEKLEGNESKWFRLPQGLRYPIELEDMRYQMHLYRRL